MPLKESNLDLGDLADLCLEYLVQNPDQLAEFMVQSGISPNALRGLISTDGFAHGLIDYVVSHEPLLVAIAAQAKLSPESFMRTWAKLHHTEH